MALLRRPLLPLPLVFVVTSFCLVESTAVKSVYQEDIASWIVRPSVGKTKHGRPSLKQKHGSHGNHTRGPISSLYSSQAGGTPYQAILPSVLSPCPIETVIRPHKLQGANKNGVRTPLQGA
ncbi:hypothetical protein J3F83DRAFT_745828 [Trichoderma novae-zelandiae]